MKTKQSNIDIQFEYSIDVEGDDNRGWQVDKIVATHNSEQVGYLKLAYIPMHRYTEYYPSIFNWMDQIRGMCILPRPSGKNFHDNVAYKAASCRHYSTFTESEAFQFLDRASLQRGAAITEENRDNMGRDALIKCIEQYEKRLLGGSIGNEFRQFHEYYVDKPIDDFVRVDAAYQREGIAEAMYEAGAIWLNERNLPFYLSTLRHPSAKALSNKMRESGKLETLVNNRERIIVHNNAL